MTLAAIAVATALTASQSHAIDHLVKKTLTTEHIAGATVAVSVHGKIAYESGFGFADIGTKRRADLDTAYPIGSVTKQFTASCVLLLAQDKKLSLDDPLSQYVPGLPWGDRVTLRHLLDQESGVEDFRLGAIDTSTRISHDQVISRLAKTDLLFPPGSRYEYSNSNYYLLGLVIEKASGKTYQSFLDSRVLQRLSLTSTFYNDGSRPNTPLAVGYNATPTGPQPVAAEDADWGYAAGSIASTVADLAKWDDALSAPGFLDAESLDEMFTPGTVDSGAATDYAFGWVAVRHDGHQLYWHNGEVTGFHAMNARFPDDRTEVVVLTNTGGTFAADRLALQIFDILHPFAPSNADRALDARRHRSHAAHRPDERRSDGRSRAFGGRAAARARRTEERQGDDRRRRRERTFLRIRRDVCKTHDPLDHGHRRHRKDLRAVDRSVAELRSAGRAKARPLQDHTFQPAHARHSSNVVERNSRSAATGSFAVRTTSNGKRNSPICSFHAAPSGPMTRFSIPS